VLIETTKVVTIILKL